MIERIKTLCAEKGININQLEKKCGISIGTISHWRKSTPRADVLYIVADALGVTMEYLLIGKPATDNDDGSKVMAEYLLGLPESRLRGILLALEAPREVFDALGLLKQQR